MRGGSNVLISPRQAAEQLGVSRKTILRRWREWGWTRHDLGYNTIRFPQRQVTAKIQDSVHAD